MSETDSGSSPDSSVANDGMSECASSAENTIAACSDGCSNDGDLYVDCDDRDCCGARSDCGSSTYCGTHPVAHGTEHLASDCTNGEDDDADGRIDCNDVSCCGAVACTATGTACHPALCTGGAAEVYSTPALGDETGPTTVDAYSGAGASAEVFLVEWAGFTAGFDPRNVATPYSASCWAFDRFSTHWSCTATISNQTWATSTEAIITNTTGCGTVRGELRLSHPTSGVTTRIDFSVNTVLQESGVTFH